MPVSSTATVTRPSSVRAWAGTTASVSPPRASRERRMGAPTRPGPGSCGDQPCGVSGGPAQPHALVDRQRGEAVGQPRRRPAWPARSRAPAAGSSTKRRCGSRACGQRRAARSGARRRPAAGRRRRSAAGRGGRSPARASRPSCALDRLARRRAAPRAQRRSRTRTRGVEERGLVEDLADRVGLVGRRRRDDHARRARRARRPPPAGAPGGRRGSSRGRGSRTPASPQQRQLAALGEQRAVGAPELAVLLEEPVVGEARAEDARAPGSPPARARRARKWIVRSTVGAARGRGQAARTATGIQASASSASAAASSGAWPSRRRIQPPVSGLVAPAERRRARAPAQSRSAGRSAASARGRGHGSTRVGARDAGRRGRRRQRRRRRPSAGERAEREDARAGRPAQTRASRVRQRPPGALDGATSTARPGGRRAQVVQVSERGRGRRRRRAGLHRPQDDRREVAAVGPARGRTSRVVSRRAVARRPSPARRRRWRARRRSRRPRRAWRQSSTQTSSTGSGIGGSGFVALTQHLLGVEVGEQPVGDRRAQALERLVGALLGDERDRVADLAVVDGVLDHGR